MFIFIKSIQFIFLSIFVTGIVFYVNLAYIADIYFQWIFNNNILDMQQYDYIVVGAGSAGAILASQLAEDKNSVLLLEAGGTAPPFLSIPVLTPRIQKTPYDWQYITVSQEHACKSLVNNQSVWPRGKILGGSSRLNYMVYVLGHWQDYEGWFPDFQEEVAENNDSISISELIWESDFANVILNAIRELNHDVGDMNTKLDIGFMKAQLTIENGERWSTDKVLYKKHNHAFTILTHALATKILVNSDKAEGIEFIRFGSKYTAMARKGVVLSAGTIESPKLLMLSGIGPRKHLEDLDIHVINDLPVGQNLVDHILSGIDLITLNENLGLLDVFKIFNPKSAFDYFLFGKGQWTSPAIEVLGTFHSALSKNKSAAPDLQLMVLPLGFSKDNGIIFKQIFGIPDEIYTKYFTSLLHENVVIIAPVLLHPKSSGEIRLRSNDPSDKPLIDPKYLSNEDDVETLIEGLYFVKELLETNALKTYGASLNTKPFPGCENEIFDTKEYWRCYVRHMTLTSHHPASTCRMGDVVDTSFKVYNMTNLYVVDASVLPSLPSGNINAAVITLARKAARMFRNEKTEEKESKITQTV